MINELINESWGWRGQARFLVRHVESGLVVAERVVRNTITTVGKNMVRDALFAPVSDISINYVAFGSGLATTTSALNNGTAYTSIACTALAQAVTAGEQITVENATNSQVWTVSGSGAAAGATSIPVTSQNANATYAIGALVASTPALAQTSLDNEQFRKAVTSQNNATNAQLITTVYVNPNEGNGFSYAEVGWFAGSSASGTAGSGIMMARLLYVPSTAKSNLVSIEVDRTDSW